MWQIDNRTPFAAEHGWTRDRDGAEIWLVAVKCTFDIYPDGTLQPSSQQPPVLRGPEYNGKPGRSSLKLESDLVMTKTTTDIIVSGQAHAPNGLPVRQLDVGFQVGPVRKMLRVFGDRIWDGSGMTPPQPFLTMPLVYERAFGGIDQHSSSPERDWEWRNPVGTGFATSLENAQGASIANIEHPNELIGSWNDHPQPAGFGPIASHWRPRADYAGTYDDRWVAQRQPLLPEDFNDLFFQCAPADQQAPAFLQGGEQVTLYRLSSFEVLNFSLPRVAIGFETHFYDGTRQKHATVRLHTIILEADFPRVSLVWHTALPCHFKVQKLDRTVVTLKAGLS
jgi:hypothetical protein